jgi:uncharacterized repeat protein (TIGR03943 family)
MAAKSSLTSRRSFASLLSWLDVLAITAWGILLLKYWLTGQLNVLIHPDYRWLTVVAGVGLLVIGALKGLQLFWMLKKRPSRRTILPTMQHVTLFPPGWSSGLLLATAILGLAIAPKAFASQTAMQRGVTDLVSVTRSRPQAFRVSVKPEQRSLIDWMRTLNVYPEPDAYTGQKVKVQGFVIHTPELPDQYFMLSRFVITCCAADAYPVGLPVKLKESRRDYPPDTWLEVEGQMITENLLNKRQLTIQPISLKKISEPKNPYDY